MLLTGKEIHDKFIVEGGKIKHARDASYDLSIDKILVDGEEKKFKYNLDPQETIFVISKEVLLMDDRHLAYAHPKTSLTYEGLLALSTGLIDPGYNGLISSAIINFDEKEKTICVGDSFLRVTAHQLTKNVEAKRTGDPKDIYFEKRKNDSNRFPNTFLDIDRNINSFQKEVLDRHERKTTNRMLLWLTALGVIFTLANYLISKASYKARTEQINSVVKEQLRTHTDQHKLPDTLPLDKTEKDSLLQIWKKSDN